MNRAVEVIPVAWWLPGSRWLSVVGLGITLGVATAWVDVRAGGLEQDGLWRATSMVLNSGSAWATLAVVSGSLIGRPFAAALGGTIALMCAVAGYYAFGVVVGDRAQVGLAGVSGAVRMWAILAVVVGPVLGFAGSQIRRSGIIGFVAGLIVPVGIVVEMLGLRRLSGETFAVDPALAWAQTSMVAVAILGAGWVMIKRYRRTENESQLGLPEEGDRP
ncbi:MAG: DUF6518 family protein [Chloroflexota bacterium]